MLPETKTKFNADYMEMQEYARNSYSKEPAARNVSTDSAYILGNVHQLDGDKDRKNIYDTLRDHVTGKELQTTGKELQTIGNDHVTGNEQMIGRDHVQAKDNVTGRGSMMTEKDLIVVTGSESLYEDLAHVSQKKIDKQYNRMKLRPTGVTCSTFCRLVQIILFVFTLMIILASSVHFLAIRGRNLDNLKRIS